MHKQPLAYFLTFCTYGSKLHGRPGGSVDRFHNHYGEPFLEPDVALEIENRERLRFEPYFLDDSLKRQTVLDSLSPTCQRKGAMLIAGQTRVNHVHALCQTDMDPMQLISELKSGATYRLNRRAGNRHPKPWSEGGSRRYLWTPTMVLKTIDYILNQQGVAMERYVDPEYESMLRKGEYRRFGRR